MLSPGLIHRIAKHARQACADGTSRRERLDLFEALLIEDEWIPNDDEDLYGHDEFALANTLFEYFEERCDGNA